MPNRPSRKMRKPDGLLAQLLDAIHECRRIEQEAARVIAKGTPPAPYEIQVTQSPGSYLPLGWGE